MSTLRFNPSFGTAWNDQENGKCTTCTMSHIYIRTWNPKKIGSKRSADNEHDTNETNDTTDTNIFTFLGGSKVVYT